MWQKLKLARRNDGTGTGKHGLETGFSEHTIFMNLFKTREQDFFAEGCAAQARVSPNPLSPRVSPPGIQRTEM